MPSQRVTVLCCVTLLGLAAWSAKVAAAESAGPPNIVILYADDLGYGDLGCYGHPTIRTPRLDRMAAEGMRLTQFYSAAPVCTPSRVALLTGQLPIRSGLTHVLFPRSTGGLQDGEITIAQALKAKGYATCCVGKWHLGHLPPYLPTRHGFDHYFGLPYSNDMLNPALPLMRDEQVIETNPDQSNLTERYTEEALKFIRQSSAANEPRKPFFLYLAYTYPHVPLHSRAPFAGKSSRGLFGDVVETIDWSVGRVLDTLRQQGVAENTFVFFSSDNGPWLTQHQRGGSAGLLRDGKGTTWEGGMREPGIAWWPGRIKPGQVNQSIGSTMDLFVTSLKLAGAAVPGDRPIDGIDLAPVLFEGRELRDRVYFYYSGIELRAVRKGPWKLHVKTGHSNAGTWQTRPDDGTAAAAKKKAAKTPASPPKPGSPRLYHLEHDPAETFDLAAQNPDVVADLLKEIEKHRAEMKPGTPQR